jgi:hypothetical protein
LTHAESGLGAGFIFHLRVHPKPEKKIQNPKQTRNPKETLKNLKKQKKPEKTTKEAHL